MGILFEIASEERLRILRALAGRPMRHAEVGRALSMTGSETTRHLNRLVAAGLVRKGSQGEHALTEVARALQAVLPLFDFLAARADYLNDHGLSALEPPFVERLGELSRAEVVRGTYRVLAVQESALKAATRRIWVVTEQRFDQGVPILRERAVRGADVRVVRSRTLLTEERRSRQDVKRNFPVKTLAPVRLFLAVVDDQAGLCLPSGDGTVDMSAMLLVSDPVGCRWCEDLFLGLWEAAEPWRLPSASSG